MGSRLYSQTERNMLTSQVNNLTSLAQPPSGGPSLPESTVALFCDPRWNATRLDLKLDDYVAGKRHRITSQMNDNADWVAWNLPIGVVMTFTDGVVDSTKLTNPADLSSAGRTIDLVGSGTTRYGMLSKMGMVDKASMFFWREVDLMQGALEVFLGPNFTEGYSTIFLCEWPRDTIVNCEQWVLNDNADSIRWKTLSDRQTMTLYANGDGSGTARYDNIKGWGNFKEIARLSDYAFGDNMGGFSWSSVNPKRELVDPIIIANPSTSDSTSLTSTNVGNNTTDAPQKTVVTLKKEDVQTLTIETSDSHHVGMSTTISQTTKAGVEGVANSETTIGITFSYDFTTTKTVTRTTSKTISVEVQQEFNCPAQKHFEASVTASIGVLPQQDFQTKATRWYDYAITNGVRDAANNNWYKREEQVAFRISGGLMSRVNWNMKTSDLPQ